MLSRRDYTVAEAKNALIQQGHAAETVDAVINEYVTNGWLSDTRCIDNRVRQLVERGYGPLYVKRIVAAMGCTVDLNQFDWKFAYTIAKRKAGSRQGLKLQQYLYRRGFINEREES